MLDVMDKAQNKRLLAPERGEPQRSGGEPNAGADNRPAAAPDPEVSARPHRRRFTPAYKARIVEEAQRCTGPGQVGALLRREGLYSSALTRGGVNTRPASLRPSRTTNAAANPPGTRGTRNSSVYAVTISGSARSSARPS